MIDNNIKYIGSGTPQEFNFDEFQQYINDGDYEGAYKYGMNFHYTNPDEQEEYFNNLQTIRHEGRRITAVKNNIDESAYPIIDFKNAVITPGGIERARKENPDNEYINRWTELKNNICPDSDRIDIVFHPEKQSFLGADFLKKDNTYYTFDKFAENLGMSKEELKASGVDVRLINGYTHVIFDKSHDLSNKILLSVPTDVTNVLNSGGYWGVLPFYQSVTKNDKNEDVFEKDPSALRYNRFWGLNSYHPHVLSLQELYNSAQDIENEALSSSTIKQYSSTYIPLEFDVSLSLEEQLNAGNIKDSQFNSRLKRETAKLIDGISGIGVGSYGIYTSYKNEDGSDLNIEANQELQREILDIYNSLGSDKSNLKFGITLSGDQVGLTVTIPGKMSGKAGHEDEVVREPIKFTIFGYGTEQLQQMINKDPGMRAVRELNDMQDLGYEYVTANNAKLQYLNNGKYLYNGTDYVNKETALHIIQADLSAEQYGRTILFNNINDNGQIVNPSNFENQCKRAALMIFQDTYGTGLLTNEEGRPYNLDEIFNAKGIGNVVNEDAKNTLRTNIPYYFSRIYEIYDNMIKMGVNYANNQ